MAKKRRRKNSAITESPCLSPTNGDDKNIPLPIVSDKVTQNLSCPITHALMVDPVLAEDGHIYERSAITEWLSKNPSSPLIPNKQMRVSNLNVVRGMQQTIEALVETGVVEKRLVDCWKARKKELDLVKAQALYDKGYILDAAKLGLPKAQGEVSSRYFEGSNGMKEDLKESYEWAKKAAEGGDMVGQCTLACFYYQEIPGTVSISFSEAISWLKKAAKQGCGLAMNNLGAMYENNGCDQDHNHLQKAASWYKKAANKCFPHSMISIGKMSYKGKGITKNHEIARRWFEKAVDVCNDESKEWLEANFWLGKMMMKGQGGTKDIKKGFDLIQNAASKGQPMAKAWLENIINALD